LPFGVHLRANTHAAIHITEIQPIFAGRIWPYERVLPNERLRAGDIVYLVEGYGDLYAWGYATKVEPYQDVNLEKEMLRVSVSRPVIRAGLLSVDQIKQQPSLAKLYAQPRAGLTELDVNQVKAFNQLIRSQGVESPADPSDDDTPVVVVSGSHRPTMERSFVLDQPVKIEERRYVEFKEIKGQNPVDSIKNTADEYAVALLNKEGGSIFWGVRDTDRVVVGVHLDYRQRDEIRRTVSQKLAQIQPSFPVSLFNLDFYPVRNEQGQEIEDLWIFEANIPGGSQTDLYATGGDEVFVKTDGGKQKLSHTQVIAEVERRKGLQRVESRDPDEDAMYAILAELTRRMQTNEGDAWYPGKEVNALKYEGCNDSRYWYMSRQKHGHSQT
jgi:hypothetical protein